jgi:hypothetical protein
VEGELTSKDGNPRAKKNVFYVSPFSMPERNHKNIRITAVTAGIGK